MVNKFTKQISYIWNYVQRTNRRDDNHKLKKNDSDYIEALYTELLGRNSDSGGKEYWCHAIQMYGPKFVLSKFLEGSEFQNNIPRIQREYKGKLNAITGYSEFAEDELLVTHLLNRSIESRIFVDAGAHSIRCSNSYYFYKHLGWSGIAIEANPLLAKELIGVLPPQVKVVNKALSIEPGNIDFFISANTFVSSTNRQAVENWGESIDRINLTSDSLQAILDAEKIPLEFGILSIDIEGSDLEVLESLLRYSLYRPRYIISELADAYSKANNSLSFSKELSESYSVIAKTPANLILQYSYLNPA